MLNEIRDIRNLYQLASKQAMIDMPKLSYLSKYCYSWFNFLIYKLNAEGRWNLSEEANVFKIMTHSTSLHSIYIINTLTFTLGVHRLRFYLCELIVEFLKHRFFLESYVMILDHHSQTVLLLGKL